MNGNNIQMINNGNSIINQKFNNNNIVNSKDKGSSNDTIDFIWAMAIVLFVSCASTFWFGILNYEKTIFYLKIFAAISIFPISITYTRIHLFKGIIDLKSCAFLFFILITAGAIFYIDTYNQHELRANDLINYALQINSQTQATENVFLNIHFSKIIDFWTNLTDSGRKFAIQINLNLFLLICLYLLNFIAGLSSLASSFNNNTLNVLAKVLYINSYKRYFIFLAIPSVIFLALSFVANSHF